MTGKETEGYEAFHAGKGLGADNPYGFMSGRDEWNKGWLYARDEQRVAWKLAHSLRRAGLLSDE